MKTARSKRSKITQEITYVKKNFIYVENCLYEKGLTDLQIHYVHLAVLAKNLTHAANALGVGREYFSTQIRKIYKKFSIGNKVELKFNMLIQNIYNLISNSPKNQNRKLYRAELNPAQRIQLLIAMNQIDKVRYIVNWNIHKLIPEENSQRISGLLLNDLAKNL